MRYLVYVDASGAIIRIVQSETARPEEYGPEPCIVTLSAEIITASTHRVLDGAVIPKEA